MQKRTALLSICLWLFGIMTAHAQTVPAISIISPAPGEVVFNNTISVLLGVPADFRMGESGYALLWLDTPTRTFENARIVSEMQYTFENVQSGLHTLEVELIHTNRASFEPKAEARVEFENAGEQLKPVNPIPGEGEAPPESNGGLFLPHGRGNTALVIILIVVAVGILWYVFGGKRPNSPNS